MSGKTSTRGVYLYNSSESCAAADSPNSRKSSKRPLRTYGRQNHQPLGAAKQKQATGTTKTSADSCPSSKKRSVTVEGNDENKPQNDGIENETQLLPGAEHDWSDRDGLNPTSRLADVQELGRRPQSSKRKLNILSYFKPVSGEDARESCSQLSPPLPSRKKTKLRRWPTDDDVTDADRPRDEASSPTAIQKELFQSSEKAIIPTRELHTLDQELGTGTSRSSSEVDETWLAAKWGKTAGGRQYNKNKNAKKAQTVLNLSVGRDASSLTMCRDCGLLYNRLNEGDRKGHARRHAAYHRRKGKLVLGGNISVE